MPTIWCQERLRLTLLANPLNTQILIRTIRLAVALSGVLNTASWIFYNSISHENSAIVDIQLYQKKIRKL